MGLKDKVKNKRAELAATQEPVRKPEPSRLPQAEDIRKDEKEAAAGTEPKPVARKGPPPTPLPKLKLEVIEGGAGEEQADKEPETRDTRPKTQDSEPDAQAAEQTTPGTASAITGFDFSDAETEPSVKATDEPSKEEYLPNVISLGTDPEVTGELTAPDEAGGSDELLPPVLIEKPAKVTRAGSEEPSEVPPVESGPVGLDTGLGGGLFGVDEDTLSGESGSLLEGPDENNGAQEGSATQSGTIVNNERGGDTLRVNPSSNKPALLSYGEEVWTSVGGALVTGCAAIGAYAMNGYRPVAIAVAGAVTVLGLVAHAINNRVNDN